LGTEPADGCRRCDGGTETARGQREDDIMRVKQLGWAALVTAAAATSFVACGDDDDDDLEDISNTVESVVENVVDTVDSVVDDITDDSGPGTTGG
jgi:hypothetical protein